MSGRTQFLPLLAALLSTPHGAADAAGIHATIGPGFVENRGQWPGEVTFARTTTRDGTVLVSDGALDLVAPGWWAGAPARLTLRFGEAGAARSPARGEEPLAGTHNFFCGDDPAGWVVGAPHYRAVVLPGVADGIDVRLYPTERGLEYDVIVQPGTDLGRFVVRCEGADSLRIDGDGSLRAIVGSAELRQTRPVAWRVDRDGRKEVVECAFELRPGGFSFAAPPEGERPLVIDPGIVWSTFFDGSQPAPGITGSGASGIWDVGLADDESVVTAGITTLLDLPSTLGAAQPQYGGGKLDLFAARFSADGSALVYATYLGGTSSEFFGGARAQPDGGIVVAGNTKPGTEYPVTPSALNGGNPFGQAMAVTGIDATGGNLLFSAVVGGSNNAGAFDVDFDPTWGITIGGLTASTDFPGIGTGWDSSLDGGGDLVLARLTPDASSVQWATYFGNSNTPSDGELDAISVMPNGDVLLCGVSSPGGGVPATPGSYFDTPTGNHQSYVARFDATGTSLLFSTYLSPGTLDRAYDVKPHPSGRIAVMGQAAASFPVTPGAYSLPWLVNGLFTCQLSADGSALVHSAVIGTPAGEFASERMAIDGAGNVVICGDTVTNARDVRLTDTPSASDAC